MNQNTSASDEFKIAKKFIDELTLVILDDPLNWQKNGAAKLEHLLHSKAAIARVDELNRVQEALDEVIPKKSPLLNLIFQARIAELQSNQDSSIIES